MIELNPFTEADWHIFSGAQRPEQGEPMIGGVTVDGDGWTAKDLEEQYASVMVDRVLIQVTACESVWQLNCDFEVGMKLAAQMPPMLRVDYLKQLNFFQIA